MFKVFKNSGLALSALLLLSVLPGRASTITFTVGTITGANVQVATTGASANVAVTVLSVPFTSLTVSTPLAIDPLPATLVYNSVAQTLTLTAGTIASGLFSNISAQTIETFQLFGPLTATVTGANAFSLNNPAIEGVTINPTFDSDLGGVYAANPPNEISNIGVSGTESAGGTTITDNSNTMTQYTPEPASCVLFGSALLATGILGRKKLFKSK